MVGIGWWAAGIAAAGYGDAEGGRPSWAERDTFLWTNAVRADPAAFADDYPCAFSSFTATEQSSQPLLRFHAGLAEVASYHSHDMDDNDYFDHDSIDGTPWDERVWSYYDGSAIGENIAFGYGSPEGTVIDGWMCSSGHRENLMDPRFDELGTGVAGGYYTQDFGNGSPPARGTTMGEHRPEDPTGDADLVVDWDGGQAPDEIFAVVDGARVDLALVHGSGGRGLYGASVPAGSGCREYYFVARLGGATETFPEDGAYGWGGCAWDDAGARWLATRAAIPGDGGGTDPDTSDTSGTPSSTDPSDPSGGEGAPDDEAPAGGSASAAGCGCASGGGSWGPWAVGALLVARRRARAR